MLTKPEHMTGWTDAMLRRHPPAIASRDYIEGYKAGLRHRIKDAQDKLGSMARIPQITLDGVICL